MKRNWSDQDIVAHAPAVAAEIIAAAAKARTEEDLRIHVNPILVRFARAVELDLHDEHEKLIGRGRADSVYGRVIIEYEEPRSLSDRNTAAKNKHAIAQVQQYALDLSKQEHLEGGRFLGVVLDGSRLIFVRQRKGAWEVAPNSREVDQDSVADLLLRLRSLRGKALLPEPLVRDFGGREERGRFTASDTAARCVTAFYHAHAASDSPKVDALFAQWRLLFSEVCGYGFDSPKLDLPTLAGSYGVTLAPLPNAKRGKTKPDSAAARQTERLFFAIHTYYATLITLLAAEIVAYYMSRDYMPSYLGKLEGLTASPLRREFAELHSTGGLFGNLGVQNFLEGDFFSWYLEAWTPDIAAALQTLVRGLRNYDPATFQVEPDETRDLLKKLYQYLLPKKLRHDLGEYYTPDWLAELVLNEIGYDGDLSKRILDPACGSGTFLALEIKRAKAWADDKMTHPAETLDAIRRNIVGFDLNPLAVIAARTNYLIALGPLLRHHAGGIEIPVYLCDAVRTPAEPVQRDLKGRRIPLETAVETFDVPLALGTPERISAMTRLLEQALRGSYASDDLLARAETELGLSPDEFRESSQCLEQLYGALRRLSEQNRNGIWARIIKNFFAPVFQVADRKFDYVAGNPPWINWESLPDDYRKKTQRLWQDYNLFTLSGWQTRMGGGKKDLSALFLYVAADKYLEDGGRLGFLVTQTLLKSVGGGEGFRRFRLPALPRRDPTPLRVIRAHDFVDVQPFEGAANRTAVLTIQKGQPTRYPLEYVVWTRKASRRPPDDVPLTQAMQHLSFTAQAGQPISSKLEGPWITGPQEALDAASRVVGESPYRAHEGLNVGGASGVYWVRALERLTDALVLVEGLPEEGKNKQLKELGAQRRPVEAELVFPLLRGRDVTPWRAEPSACILVPHNAAGGEPHSLKDMAKCYPRAYAYLGLFKDMLLGRNATQYRGVLQKGRQPFYWICNVKVAGGRPALDKWKVLWREVSDTMQAAVCGPCQMPFLDERVAVPAHTLVGIPCDDDKEAHFLCAVLQSAPARFVVESYVHLHVSPHILNYVNLPRFRRRSVLHVRLSKLSLAAHEAAAADDQKRLRDIEQQVDEAAAELWGITPVELKTIQKALADRKRPRPTPTDDA